MGTMYSVYSKIDHKGLYILRHTYADMLVYVSPNSKIGGFALEIFELPCTILCSTELELY